MSTDLRIGDRVFYHGRACVVRGFTPMSVQPPGILLDGLGEPGSLVTAAPEEVQQEDSGEAAA
jgi:hypothetical protein